MSLPPRVPLTERDFAYAERLLAWARTAEEHGLSFQDYESLLDSDTESEGANLCSASN